MKEKLFIKYLLAHLIGNSTYITLQIICMYILIIRFPQYWDIRILYFQRKLREYKNE